MVEGENYYSLVNGRIVQIGGPNDARREHCAFGGIAKPTFRRKATLPVEVGQTR